MREGIHVHIDLDDQHYEAARYAFEVLLATVQSPVAFHRHPPSRLSSDAVLITYSRAAITPSHRRHLVIRASRRLWDRYGAESSIPPAPFTRMSLAFLGARPGPRLVDPLVLPYVSEVGPLAAEMRHGDDAGCEASLVTGVDLVASAFFWITRYEEILIRERDEAGRIPQGRLSAIVEGLTERPLVDEYSDLLITWLRLLQPGIESERAPFRALLTHDVDTGIGVRGLWNHVDNGLRALYRDMVTQRRPLTGVLGLRHWLSRGLGFQPETALFQDIVELDAQFGFRPLFFLMANGTHACDATYDIAGDAARRVMRTIRATGGTVGLHVGLNAHHPDGQLRKEWDQLRHAEPDATPVARTHYLAFFAPATWRRLEQLGFTADSSLGFSHHIGFRAGTCRVFRPFDVERGEILSIWEMPMAIRDVNLFHRPARDVARIEAATALAARVRAHGGCLVVNWHNVSYLGHYRKVYRALVAALQGALPMTADCLPAAKEAVIW